ASFIDAVAQILLVQLAENQGPVFFVDTTILASLDAIKNLDIGKYLGQPHKEILSTVFLDVDENVELRGNALDSVTFESAPILLFLTSSKLTQAKDYFARLTSFESVMDSTNTNEYANFLNNISKDEEIIVQRIPENLISWWKWTSGSIEDYFKIWRMSTVSFKNDFENLKVISEKAYARIGVLGNPSDGFYGKTLGLLISNFHAKVTLIPNLTKSTEIRIIPNTLTDPVYFPSLSSVFGVLSKNGVYGTQRLLVAALKTFVGYCSRLGIKLNKRGFSISSLLRALMTYNEINHEIISKPMLANIALEVETKELGIQAGLQDRVMQGNKFISK
ncbi:hypothetical protein HK096_003518, partial [Nowakowskiella sp. JEL0078]